MKTNRLYSYRLLIAIVLVVACAHQASAQQPDKTGSLTITVTDADIKLPVIGSLASLTSRNGGSPILIKSDEHGVVSFKSVPRGLYRLKVSLKGYFPEFIDSLMIHADSVVSKSLQMYPYNGVTEYDAYEDLAKGIVRLFRSEWLLGPGVYVSAKYGFRIELKCCDSTFKFDRYNNVVYEYLDSLNGPGWYEKYMRDLWLEKAKSDSVSRRPENRELRGK
jgi:hypothetical protein